MKAIAVAVTCLAALTSHISLGAETGAPLSGEAISRADEMRAAAEAQFKLTFTNTVPEFIGPSEVPGMYEVLTGGRLLYFWPDKKWLFFGEIYDATGRSISAERLGELMKGRVDALVLDEAVKVGDGPIKVIEFVDPDCPYCRQWHDLAKTRSDLTRYVFFVPQDALHPLAAKKAEHILCAKDPIKTLEGMYERADATDKLVGCEAGRSRLDHHRQYAQKLGLSGTPSLVINGQVVAGFQPARINNLLNQAKESKQ